VLLRLLLLVPPEGTFCHHHIATNPDNDAATKYHHFQYWQFGCQHHHFYHNHQLFVTCLFASHRMNIFITTVTVSMVLQPILMRQNMESCVNVNIYCMILWYCKYSSQKAKIIKCIYEKIFIITKKLLLL